jgi:hypothetical protein
MSVWGAAIAIAAGFLMWLLRRFCGGLADYGARWRKRAAESESVYFWRVMRASRANDPQETYRSTLAWLDRVWDGRVQPVTLDRAVRVAADENLARESARLTAALFGRPGLPETDWSGDEFSQVLRRARPRLIVVRRAKAERSLPPLNPV